eukprot:1194962-Prorocentrum_minimum.AAC.6
MQKILDTAHTHFFYTFGCIPSFIRSWNTLCTATAALLVSVVTRIALSEARHPHCCPHSRAPGGRESRRRPARADTTKHSAPILVTSQ